MVKCPANPNPQNCAIEAAQDLVDREAVVIDYVASTLDETGFYLGRNDSAMLDVFSVRRIRAEGLTDVAELGCVACGRCIDVVDDAGDMSVRFSSA